MGIIKKVGEIISDVGERIDRAGASVMSGVGYRSRTHALRSRIDSLPVPRVGGAKARAQARAKVPRKAREAAKTQQNDDNPSYNPNVMEISFRET